MKITAITTGKRDNNRVNVSVDGKYRFSLDLYQLTDLGIKVGNEYDEKELCRLEQESQFGKVYARSLEYCLIRPRSEMEIYQYLYRRTVARRTKTGQLKEGIDKSLIPRVIDRLKEKEYINDRKFAEYWVENRMLKKGISLRKLIAELRGKGVESSIIEEVMEATDRDDMTEIRKVIQKKRRLYSDEQKLMTYLARAGFSYDKIKQALSEDI